MELTFIKYLLVPGGMQIAEDKTMEKTDMDIVLLELKFNRLFIGSL